jgi:hypothetical protein
MRTTTTIAIAAAVAVTLAAAPAAAADPGQKLADTICTAVDNWPTFDTLAAVGLALMDKGASAEEAATAIVISIHNYCPRNLPLLERYAASGRRTV